MMRALTDEPMYQNSYSIPENECFVSAVVEVRAFHPLLTTKKPDKLHTLKITHSIPDRRMWSKVVVRQWSGGKCRELKRSEDYQEAASMLMNISSPFTQEHLMYLLVLFVRRFVKPGNMQLSLVS